MGSHHQPSNPHFFKPVLPGSDQQLSIPNAYTGYLKEEKAEGDAILKSDNIVGGRWRVKFDGKNFGGDGWNKFAREHELDVGDFLVFRHNGGLVFHVTVFDSTACQRDYLLQDEAPKTEQSTQREQKQGNDLQNSTSSGTSIPEEKALHFTTKLKRTNFKYCYLLIPAQFAKSNGLNNRCCVISLRNKEGESWPVNLRHRKTLPETYISGGWKEFLKGNRLKMGDTCTFRLISKVVLEFTICQSQYENERRETFNWTACEREYLKNGGKMKYTERREEDNGRMSFHFSASSSTPFTSLTPPSTNVDQEEEAPNFTTKLNLTNLRHKIVNIPAKFARANGLSERCGKITLRDEKGVAWEVSMNYMKMHDLVSIKGGWSKFSYANMLKIGDVCTFKLVSTGQKVVFEVTVSRFTI